MPSLDPTYSREPPVGSLTSVGVEFTNAPGTASLPSAGSPSIQRATRAASASVTPRPSVFSVAALVMVPAASTCTLTMVAPSEVQTFRCFQKLGLTVASKPVATSHFTVGVVVLTS